MSGIEPHEEPTHVRLFLHDGQGNVEHVALIPRPRFWPKLVQWGDRFYLLHHGDEYTREFPLQIPSEPNAQG